MRLSNRDLELLSAYLDGEIPQKERERLQARLQTDTALREVFDQLQHTRATIRSLPTLHAPRNFFLTPDMVGQKQAPRRAFPILSFASVIASVLFVLIFLGDLLVIQNPALSPLSAEKYSELIVEPADTATVIPQEPSSQLPEAQADVTVEQPSAEEEAASPLVEPPSELESLLPTVVPTPAVESKSVLGEGIIQTEEPRIAAEGRASVTPLPEEPRVVIPLRIFVLTSEVVLIIVAVTTGLAAFLISRRGG